MIRSLFRRASVALFATLGAWMFATQCAGAAEVVRIGGTGAALGTMERLAAEFRKRQPDFAYEVIPNLGSGGGLKALAKGAIQIAVTGRPLKQEDSAGDLVAIEYGRTPFVVATAKPGIKGLTRTQLAEMYGNAQARWPDGSPVRPVLRPAPDIDSELLAKFSPEVKAALAAAMGREGMVVAATDRESADAIEKLPGAIGTSSLALLLSEGRHLTPLAIDGVQPSVRSLADGSYPHAKTTWMVVHKRVTGATEKFLAFIASDEGRRVLVETGHVLPATRR